MIKIDKRIKIKIIYLLVVSAALVITLIPLGAWGHETKLQATLVSFFFFSWWQLGRQKRFLSRGTVVVAILLPGCLFYGLVHALGWRDSLISLPSSLAFLPGTFLGAAMATEKRFVTLKKCVAIAMVVFIFSCARYGYTKWMHKLNYGSFSGRVLEEVSMVQITGENGDLMNADDLSGKVVILDFWTTSCAACFVKFPMVEALHQELATRKDIFLLAVNVPGKEERSAAIKLIRDRGFTFNIGFMNVEDVKDVLRINAFPTVIALRDGTHIFYRGDIENVSALLDE